MESPARHPRLLPFVSRAPTGSRTSRSSSPRSPPANSPRCRLITSWISTRAWRKQRRRKCRWRPRLPVASGFRTRSWPCTQPNGIGPVFRAGMKVSHARRIWGVISGHRVMSAPGPVPSDTFAGALTILSAVSECRCSTRRHSTNPAGWGYHYATECPSKIRRKRVSRSRRSCTARETRSSSGALQETQV